MKKRKMKIVGIVLVGFALMGSASDCIDSILDDLIPQFSINPPSSYLKGVNVVDAFDSSSFKLAELEMSEDPNTSEHFKCNNVFDALNSVSLYMDTEGDLTSGDNQLYASLMSFLTVKTKECEMAIFNDSSVSLDDVVEADGISQLELHGIWFGWEGSYGKVVDIVTGRSDIPDQTLINYAGGYEKGDNIINYVGQINNITNGGKVTREVVRLIEVKDSSDNIKYQIFQNIRQANGSTMEVTGKLLPDVKGKNRLEVYRVAHTGMDVTTYLGSRSAESVFTSYDGVEFDLRGARRGNPPGLVSGVKNAGSASSTFAELDSEIKTLQDRFDYPLKDILTDAFTENVLKKDVR